MSKSANIARFLAQKVFALQKRTGGGVPGRVMASARMILQNKSSPTDVSVVQRYLGISRSGSSQIKRGFSEVRKTIEKVGQFGVLANVASSGGATGFAASMQLGQMASKEIEKLASSKAFQASLEQAVDRFFSGSKAEKLIQATRLGYSIRRGARMLGAGVAGLQAGVAITRFSMGAAEALSGEGGEALRIAKSESAIANSDGRMSSRQKELAAIRAQQEKVAAQTGFLPMGLGNIAARAMGSSALSSRAAKLQVEESLRSAGFGNGVTSEAASLKGRERVLSERYGMLGAALAGKAESILDYTGLQSKSKLDQEAADKASASIQRAAGMRQKAFEASGRQEYDLAFVYLSEANKEMPGSVAAWMNPETIWKQEMTNRAAARVWARMNMTRAGPRTGD